MRALRDRCGETVNLGVLMGDDVLYLAVLPSDHALRMASSIGDREAAHLTSIGRAMLANMPEAGGWKGRTAEAIEFAQRNGYALDDEEFMRGARCVGAPVRDAAGQVRWGLSISGPVSRLVDERLPALGALVIQAAQDISRRLGYNGSPNGRTLYSLAPAIPLPRTTEVRRPRRFSEPF
jgi:IclR family acetate operon transcriptional repressor